MRYPTKAAPGQPPGATAQSLRPLAQITNQNPYHLVPEVARYRVTSGPRWTNGAHTSNTKVYAATLWELGSNFWRGRQLRKSRRKGVFLDGITKKRCCQPRFRTVDRERPNLSTLTSHPCMSKRTPDLRRVRPTGSARGGAWAPRYGQLAGPAVVPYLTPLSFTRRGLLK